MNRWKRPFLWLVDWPLAARIIVLACGACAAVAILMATIGYDQAAKGLQAQAEKSLWCDGVAIIESIDHWNTDQLKTLRVVADTGAVRDLLSQRPGAVPTGPITALQDVLNSNARVNPDVDSIAVVDTTGAIRASTSPTDIGQNVGLADYFRSALAGNPFISGVSFSTTSNAPSIFHSVPVLAADGRILGVVRSRATVTEIQRAVDGGRDRAGQGAAGFLIDESGLVVASSVNSVGLLQPVIPLSADAMQKMVQDRRWGDSNPPAALGIPSLTQAIGIHDQVKFDVTMAQDDYYALAMPTQETRWSYVGVIPDETVEEAAQGLRQNVLIVTGIVLLVALLLTAFTARGITGRLARLGRAAGALEAGTLNDAEIDTLERSEGRDEVAMLMRVFGRAARDLKRREEGLRQEVRTLQIEIDHAKAAQEVAEITESEFFVELQAKAKRMRQQKAPKDDALLNQETIDTYIAQMRSDLAERRRRAVAEIPQDRAKTPARESLGSATG